MPRSPDVAASVSSIPGSVFSALAHRLANHDGEVYPFHVGDTWLEPEEGCRMQDLSVAEFPGMHRYAPPQGRADLTAAIVERLRARTGVPVQPGQVLVAAGATGALGAVVGAIADPGDEVILAAPYWPLISGIVRSFHGEPVPVPLFGAVDTPEGAVEAVEAALTERTVALYFNTPNNPTGLALPRPTLEALVEWASRHGLWILADEVYEDYDYRGEHTYALPLAPERTFSVHSFSKAFGMAGNRCGYVIGPQEVMDSVRKVSTHTFYSTPTASQIAAVRALDERGDRWVRRIRDRYREVGEAAAARLGLPAPDGSQFLFLDISGQLDDGGLMGFLEECVDEGLFLAPGPSFGPYPTNVRLCYTAVEPAVTARGIEVLAGLLARRTR